MVQVQFSTGVLLLAAAAAPKLFHRGRLGADIEKTTFGASPAGPRVGVVPMVKTRSGRGEQQWFDRLSMREDVKTAEKRTAAYYGEQAIENWHNMSARRLREANPRPQGAESVRAAAMSMADKAVDKPLPTSVPQTVNGVTKSETMRQEDRDYRVWRAELESAAMEEVRKDLMAEKKLTKNAQRRFRNEIPSAVPHDVSKYANQSVGKAVAGDWRPALW